MKTRKNETTIIWGANEVVVVWFYRTLSRKINTAERVTEVVVVRQPHVVNVFCSGEISSTIETMGTKALLCTKNLITISL
jgi:hypothetical protein